MSCCEKSQCKRSKNFQSSICTKANDWFLWPDLRFLAHHAKYVGRFQAEQFRKGGFQGAAGVEISENGSKLQFRLENPNSAEMMIQKSKRRPKDHHSKNRVGRRSEKFLFSRIMSILHLIYSVFQTSSKYLNHRWLRVSTNFLIHWTFSNTHKTFWIKKLQL